MKTYEEIKQLPTEEAIDALSAIIEADPTAEEAYIERGMRYWSLGKRSNAMNDYLAALKLNKHSKASTLIASANQILNFYNKDIYNP